MSPDSDQRLQRFVSRMPKVELHLHIEGAIPPETLFEMAREKGDDPPLRDLEDLRRKLTYTDFAHFIELWTWMTTLLREEEDFERIAYDALKALSAQNVKHVEASYSPGDYWRQGFSVQGITESLLRGRARAQAELGIRCQFIVDLIRDHGPERGARYLDEVTPYLGQGVVGIGLGGSEQDFRADPYASLYREAERRGFRLTAHAGEVAGAESIWTVARKLGVQRIGHCTRAYEDPDLVLFLSEQQIPLEMCVTSNVRTGVTKSVEAHPIGEYFRQGLRVVVNSDDPTMFNTSITQEYETLVRRLGFSLEDLKQLSTNAVEASFMSQDEKAAMKLLFQKEWEELGESPL
ncbi:MAG: adenosine deaminase [Candidatus Eiseniibacteriota bacterium]|nr:MAG: adenosine deaminase [Candidatus Eisenbacteria bacterium]